MPPRVVRVVGDALDAPGGPHPGEHLLVATSGGPDSTAVLVALAELAAARTLVLTAAHVDHRLRGDEAAEEGRGVALLAAGLGVPFVATLAPVEPGANLEERARRARYRALEAIARDVGATRIVTGHTRDDQVETFLLRLLRGTGRRGLGGMRAIQGRLLRPLLGATRTDVRRFLAERDVPHAVDRSNADLRFVRNRVRRLLVPFLASEFNPHLGVALAGLARRLGDEDDLLAMLARERGAGLLLGDDLGVAVADEPPALARRIVRAWLERPPGRRVTAVHVERVLGLASGAGRGAVAVAGPARVLRERDRLVRRPGREPSQAGFARQILPGGSVRHPTAGWELRLSAPRSRAPHEERPRDGLCALFDAEHLPLALTVRSPVRGDRVHLLGGGTRKLQDILVDAKMPREERATTPILSAGDEILWVAGLARGSRAPVGRDTRQIVEGILAPGKRSADCRC